MFVLVILLVADSSVVCLHELSPGEAKPLVKPYRVFQILDWQTDENFGGHGVTLGLCFVRFNGPFPCLL